MKQLPKKFEKRGFLYEQEEIISGVYIYSQFDMIHKTVVGYEVIKPRFQKENTNTGRFEVEKGYYYPSDAQWGKGAFTAKSLSEARTIAESSRF